MRVTPATNDNVRLKRTVQRQFTQSLTDHYRAHTVGTNINPKTLLTTDYLNHFSGILMLLELLPMDPDSLSKDVLEWSPMSYEEHFEVTGFRDKNLAVKAYQHAPFEIRDSFDSVIDNLNDLLVDLLGEVRNHLADGAHDKMSTTCLQVLPDIRKLIETAAHIVNDGPSNVVTIHQEDEGEMQEQVDAIFEE